MTDAARKVILRLKEARAQKHLSYQDVVEACEASNIPVSLSTIKRIFARGSEDSGDFRISTVNAVFNAIIGTEDVELSAADEASLSDTEKEIVTENAALKAVVELRDATIADLQQQLAQLRQDIELRDDAINTLQIRLDAVTDLFKLAMESLGRGSVVK